jgi:hypothetical protein
MNENINYDTPSYWRKYGKDNVPDDLVPHIERAVANDTISTCDQHDKRNPLAVLLGAVLALALGCSLATYAVLAFIK